MIHYFERTVVYRAFNKCNWDNWEEWPEGSEPHHSAVLGDPQIVDAFSYPTRPAILMALTRILSDNYLHRNYQIMHKVLKQHSTLFVGDLFDGGREWNDTDWFPEFDRFVSIFPKQENNRRYWPVPGNHDVGFGTGIKYRNYKRFRAYFGSTEDYTVLGNHSVVFLDTVSLSDTDNKDISGAMTEFLQSMKDDDHPSKKYPRIVITHVPLYRDPEMQQCGPWRDSPNKFPLMKGVQYQTVIEYKYSREILDWIKPKLILSGDDHDYCHVRHPLDRSGLDANDHTYSHGKDTVGRQFADEITVKTTAMTGGQRWPAVQLLSLWNPIDKVGESLNPANEEQWHDTGDQTVLHDTYESHLCFLPDFIFPIICYSVLAVISFGSLFLCTILPRITAKLQHILTSVRFTNKKDEILPLTEGGSFKGKSIGRSSLIKQLLLDWQLPNKASWSSFLVQSLLLGAFILYAFHKAYTSI